MTPFEAIAHNAEQRSRIVEMLTRCAGYGAASRDAKQDIGMSHTVFIRHVKTLIEAGEVVASGAGNRRRYRLRQFPAVAAVRPEKETLALVIDGRRHVLARHVVRSVFELGVAA